jgi:hypothetical protein
MSTTRLARLLIVHGRARCPSRGWYAQEPHDKGEKAVGFMVSTTTGKVGEDKRVCVCFAYLCTPPCVEGGLHRVLRGEAGEWERARGGLRPRLGRRLGRFRGGPGVGLGDSSACER